MRFRRDQHLRARREFEQVRRTGRRVDCGSFLVQATPNPDQSASRRRLGVIATRRVGNAVHRNRAKRLMRELFRNGQHQLPESCDVVLLARPGITSKRYADLTGGFERAARKLRRDFGESVHDT